eukprot:887699-Prymnesium_polylepis.1
MAPSVDGIGPSVRVRKHVVLSWCRQGRFRVYCGRALRVSQPIRSPPRCASRRERGCGGCSRSPTR